MFSSEFRDAHHPPEAHARLAAHPFSFSSAPFFCRIYIYSSRRKKKKVRELCPFRRRRFVFSRDILRRSRRLLPYAAGHVHAKLLRGTKKLVFFFVNFSSKVPGMPVNMRNLSALTRMRGGGQGPPAALWVPPRRPSGAPPPAPWQGATPHLRLVARGPHKALWLPSLSPWCGPNQGKKNVPRT